MVKVLFINSYLLLVCLITFGQGSLTDKGVSELTKERFTEIKKEGWTIKDKKALKLALKAHYSQLLDNNAREVVGQSKAYSSEAGLKSAYNNAILALVKSESENVKTKFESNFSDNLASNKKNQTRFNSSIEKNLGTGLESILKESVRLEREKAGLKEYKILFIVNNEMTEQIKDEVINKIASQYAFSSKTNVKE